MLLTFKKVSPGIHEGILDLGVLFPGERSLYKFDKKWRDFLRSDIMNEKLFIRKGHELLIYRTETLIPPKPEDRPPLLLLLGNPASHSVNSGICFSYEGSGKEHRFWKALRKTKILEFFSNAHLSNMDLKSQINLRRRELLNLEYYSPFRIGITVYFSIPSPASHPQWSGVNGLIRLFGRKALRTIAFEEQKRIKFIIQKFMPSGGGIFAFQRDAYEGLRHSSDPPYCLSHAQKGKLISRCKFRSDVYLFGLLPTRLLNSEKALSILTQSKELLLEKLKIRRQ